MFLFDDGFIRVEITGKNGKRDSIVMGCPDISVNEALSAETIFRDKAGKVLFTVELAVPHDVELNTRGGE